MTTQRLERVCALMQQYKVEALAINAGPDLKYLTGLDFHLSERPALLLLTAAGKAAFVFPEFEQDKASHSAIPVDLFPYPEDAKVWPAVVYHALADLNLINIPLAVSPVAMRFLEMDLLRQAVPETEFISGGDIFRDIYICKDEQEIRAVRKAIEIAQTALLNTLPLIEPGKTEKEIANQLVVNLLYAGCEPELPFSPIVAGGPNSANPHANPGDRPLQTGDILIIDWGARFDGYVSDLTRTFAIGSIPEPFKEISGIVLSANQAARARIKPGVLAGDVDAAARDTIIDGGYGKQFLHRTGHGIGQLPHEEPYISSVSTTDLQPGMLFTIEPGIYLTGIGGVRIEDNVLVTESGVDTLSDLPRNLVIL
ncbi:MAG: aminopeptidase P family protein [Anaerolineae bacterium]|jgi:Xaa-Pro dipeptidase|nr:aminopeptidase P family protein [Anaerolineae bacterium]